MKITTTKVRGVLKKEYEWDSTVLDDEFYINLIRDTLKVVNEILISQGQKSIR